MKHCVITGAADGIGKALAQHFAQAGYRITGIDIDHEQAAQTESQLTTDGHLANFIIADLTKQADVKHTLSMLAQGPDIDVLVHNAGINAVGHFGDIPLAAQQRVLDLNLIAPQLLTAGFLQSDKLASSGSLVFISSLSHYVSYPGAAVYAAAKDGLTSYARSLSVSLAEKNIHVLTVFPGPTRTKHARRYSPDNSTEEKRMPPEILAAHIFTAVQKRQYHLIPGLSNRMFAFVGRLFPSLAQLAMRKIILEKLTTAR